MGCGAWWSRAHPVAVQEECRPLSKAGDGRVDDLDFRDPCMLLQCCAESNDLRVIVLELPAAGTRIRGHR